jgi:hypothetical protein
LYLIKAGTRKSSPEQVLRIPGRWGSQISIQRAHESCKFVNPERRQQIMFRSTKNKVMVKRLELEYQRGVEEEEEEENKKKKKEKRKVLK